jgi:hypothetical protein
MSYLEKYDTLRKQMDAARMQMKQIAEQCIKEGFQSIFDEYPHVESIWWTQYTQYWNDGEPCHFHVRTSSLEVICDENSSEDDPWFNDAYGKAEALLEAFDEGDMEAVFGDHVQVNVTRDGFEVSEYDHD